MLRIRWAGLGAWRSAIKSLLPWTRTQVSGDRPVNSCRGENGEMEWCAGTAVFCVDRISLDTGEIVESHTVLDRDPWSALTQVTRSFHDPDEPGLLGGYADTPGDLRIQDQDDLHFWMVVREPDEAEELP